MFDRFCEVVELDLGADERFATLASRSANRGAMNELISARLRTRTTDEWVDDLNAAGVPCGPVYRVDEVFADPQVHHLHMVDTVEHPALGPLDILRNAVSMNDGPPTVRTAAPDPGAHTDEVLTSLGYDQEHIDDLRARGIV